MKNIFLPNRMPECPPQKKGTYLCRVVVHDDVVWRELNFEKGVFVVSEYMSVLFWVKEVQVRESVQWFALEMEKKLSENDHKGGWGKCELQYLSKRLTDERKELYDAIADGDPETIISECADIANFAMMIADRYKNNFGK